MNNAKLIAQQALKIAELEESVSEYKSACSYISGVIYCIGGPLNDNKLKYTQKQMADFGAIADRIKYL